MYVCVQAHACQSVRSSAGEASCKPVNVCMQVDHSKSSEYDVAAQKLQTEEMARKLDADLVQVCMCMGGEGLYV